MYSTGLQALICSASRLKKESRISYRDINGLMDREELRLWKQGLEVTVHCVWQTIGRTRQQSSSAGRGEGLGRGRGRLPSVQRTNVRETSRRRWPFDKLS